MIRAANRLQTVEEYYFSRKLKEVAAMNAEGKSVINLGIGSPDLQPPTAVTTALTQSINNTTAHKYQSYQGLPELRLAISQFYNKNFKVNVNPDHEILPLMGSKEGIMHISMAYLNAGDQVLIPNPGYPTYQSVTKLVGATPRFYDLEETNNWLPNFEALENTDLSKVKLMWVNYPHMPTGTNAPLQLFKNLIAFAKRHSILIVNDNPYSFILNDNPISILQIEGAKDVAIELNSLSKTFNMAGWRVGMVLGNKHIIQNILKVKSNMDSGMFFGLQKGAIEALNLSDDWFKHINSIYKKRRELTWLLADKLNCTYSKNTSGMFVWAKLPKGQTSETVIDNILKNNHIFITPGTIFGSKGEGYIRFSLCANQQQLNDALKRLNQ